MEMMENSICNQHVLLCSLRAAMLKMGKIANLTNDNGTLQLPDS